MGNHVTADNGKASRVDRKHTWDFAAICWQILSNNQSQAELETWALNCFISLSKIKALLLDETTGRTEIWYPNSVLQLKQLRR